MKRFTIPGNVKSIGHDAFYFCLSLTDITIEEGLTTIAYNAFYRCDKLTNVTFGNAEGWSVADSADATEWISISSTELQNTTIAATYLKSTYSSKHWKCSTEN